MADPISDNAMNTLFRRARSFNDWTDAAVPEVLMRAAYDLAKWGPTSANASPARFIFLPKDSDCLLYTSPSPRDATLSRMPSSA